MGRKSTGARQFFFLCAASLILFPLLGCIQSKSQVTSEAEVHPVPLRQPAASLNPALIHLEEAQRLFDQGDFEASRRENQIVLSLTGKNPPGDRALYNTALIYASSVNPKKDFDRCLYFLQRLLQDYPQSPFAREARVWLTLLQENEQLRKVLEKVQQVDLEVERKKREKAR